MIALTVYVLLPALVALVVFLVSAYLRRNASVFEANPKSRILPETKFKPFRFKSVVCGDAVVSNGTEITARAYSLGAPALPDTAQYVFFPSLEVVQKDHSCFSDTYVNCVAVVWDEKVYASEVRSSTDIETGFVNAANKASVKFQYDYDKWVETERIKDFVQNQTIAVEGLLKSNGFPTIGDKQKWVED